MLKNDLRSKYSNLRKDLAPEGVMNASLAIANKLLQVPIWEKEYYHLFLSITEKKEVDTSFILSILQGKDKNIVLPKVDSEGTLQHYLLTDSTRLVKTRWGVPEPVEGVEVPIAKMDVVFVPLLAFDLTGNRVGYGKGFYDSFLGQCHKNVIKVGLSFFKAENKIADVEEHDIRLDYCVTPEEIYSFSAR